MEDPSKEAPLVTLSGVAPSLESTPKKSEEIIFMEPSEKAEVTFKTDDEYSTSSSSSSSDSDSEDEAVKPKIPDGGWGWVVVFSSLLLSMIADGVSFSFGLLYPQFQDEFKASSSDTSWIGSLFLAVPLISGPIMSAFVDKYGCKNMTILGGIISAIGFIISSKVNTIGIMYLTFGILAGLGLGLCYVTAVVSIAFWFDKKRSLAVGISASGAGIGTFVFSPLTNWLIYELGWRGTTLILGGIFLNMCVCGVLMIDPDWITEQHKLNPKLSKSSKSSKTSLISLSSTNFINNIDINELKDVLKSGKNVEYLLQRLETSIETNKSDEPTLKNNHNSVLNLPTYIRQNEKVPIEVLEQLSSNKKIYNVILENFPSLVMCRSTSDRGLNKLAEDASLVERVPVKVCVTLKKDDKEINRKDSLIDKDVEAQKPLLVEKPSKKQGGMPRNPTLPKHKNQIAVQQRQHYFKNLKLHRQSLVHRAAIFNTNKYRFKASSCPNIYRVSTLTLKHDDEKWYDEPLDLVKGMFDFSLFLELHFFFLSISTITLFVWFIVPYFYLTDHMTKHGYSTDEASLTISNIGITNMIGMIAFGWAGDQPWMNITKTYAISLFLTGVSCAGMMFFTSNYIILEISAAMFGMFVSSTYTFTPGIIVELVPLERFTTAYGLQLMCMGIGLLLGPPFAGHLFDVTQSWEQTFYQAAIWLTVAGLLVAFIPYTKNRKMFGTGMVEKEVEDLKDRIWMAVALLVITLILIVIAMYFIIECLI